MADNQGEDDEWEHIPSKTERHRWESAKKAAKRAQEYADDDDDENAAPTVRKQLKAYEEEERKAKEERRKAEEEKRQQWRKEHHEEAKELSAVEAIYKLGPDQLPSFNTKSKSEKEKLAKKARSKKAEAPKKKQKTEALKLISIEDAAASISSQAIGSKIKEYSSTYPGLYDVQLTRLAEYFEQHFENLDAPPIKLTLSSNHIGEPAKWISSDVQDKVSKWVAAMPLPNLTSFILMLVSTTFSIRESTPPRGYGFASLVQIIVSAVPSCFTGEDSKVKEMLKGSESLPCIWALSQLMNTAPLNALSIWLEMLFSHAIAKDPLQRDAEKFSQLLVQFIEEARAVSPLQVTELEYRWLCRGIEKMVDLAVSEKLSPELQSIYRVILQLPRLLSYLPTPVFKTLLHISDNELIREQAVGMLVEGLQNRDSYISWTQCFAKHPVASHRLLTYVLSEQESVNVEHLEEFLLTISVLVAKLLKDLQNPNYPVLQAINKLVKERLEISCEECEEVSAPVTAHKHSGRLCYCIFGLTSVLLAAGISYAYTQGLNKDMCSEVLHKLGMESYLSYCPR